MPESSDDLKRMIADFEEKRRQLGVILNHLHAALDEIEAKTPATPAAAPAKKRSRSAKTGRIIAAHKKGDRGRGAGGRKPGGGVPFAPKYDVPIGVGVVEVLSEPKNLDGLALRALQGALAQKGKDYSDQAVNLALKKLIKAGDVLRVPAPEISSSKWLYKLAQVRPLFQFPSKAGGKGAQ